jgi:rhamnogalacturonan endolyase
MNKIKICWIIVLMFTLSSAFAQRQMEDLNRGIIAVRQNSDSVFISWRLLGTEPDNLAFNLYRKAGSNAPVKLNDSPLLQGTFFIDKFSDFSQPVSYYVTTLAGENESVPSETYTIPKDAGVGNYISIPLRTPKGYTPGDASVGDLDGDGEYEIVIHMTGIGHDNGQGGFTSEPIFQAYKLNGKFLWSINLGKNIREGAHYTQFLVYDFDGDGKAEVVMKTADGTRDGLGKVIGDSTVDDRNDYGHICRGPEFLTVFDGSTGAALATAKYIPGRYPGKNNPTPEEMKSVWGDNHYNRSERYLACVAYLDGVHPSIVMCRGYYTRVTMAAWDWRRGKLTNRWLFDSDDGTPGNSAYHGQGNHNLSVGDVDGDGKDEIMYGSCAIDDNGKGLYSTGLGHADAMHFSDLDPDKPGLEVFNTQERFDDAGMNFRNAATGEIYWKVASVKADEEGSDKGEGPGRAASFNIDPRYRGSECWVRGAGMDGLYSAQGKRISDRAPRSCNFGIWWDGDLLRELLDRNTISKWNWNSEETETIFEADGCWSNNGTKSTPAISADLFGDWREEVVFRTNDNQYLRIYTTTIPTKYRLYTLMHDPIYRLGIAWQNVAYNQPPHTGFYMGDDMEKAPKPNIILVPKPVQKP